ncbi:MAG: beta-galactosidase [Chloroflexi bacterium]|nr:beta-galactosidase [Chloroflexota bacterium]
MTRPEWQNLNGLWEYGITKKAKNEKQNHEGQILVPFPIESALSGVKRRLGPDDWLWYRRTFSIPDAWRGKRVLLHFGAVDWETKVFVNDQPVGEHVGGYLPFWFDVTDVLQDGENELKVRVWDPTDSHWQQRGKQVLKPKSIWYTAVSGIWQTVWLEPVPQTYIAGLKIIPDVDTGTVGVRVMLAGTESSAGGASVRVYDGGVEIAAAETEDARVEIRVPIPYPKLWSPDLPHLYDLEITAGEDKVGSYFGMRKFSVEAGRLCLNNQPLFQFGPLDQGYWPDGLYTPPTDEAMRRDVELVKGLGFNMLRKHVKVEPARYYYFCDRMGLIVWQDMPNGGKMVGEIPTFLALTFGSRRRDSDYRYAGRTDEASRQEFLRELQEMVDALYNFTCIGMWVPFNEGWGQFQAKEIAKRVKSYDPTRLVDHASGWFDRRGGDFKSLHIYMRKLFPPKSLRGRAFVISEFGGYGLQLAGHVWDEQKKFSQRFYDSSEALTQAYLDTLEKELKPLIPRGLAAAIYTQTTDVEIDINGYLTYDRRVEKMDAERIREAHLGLYDDSGV